MPGEFIPDPAPDEFVPDQPPRSALGEIGTALKRGFYQGVRGAGAVLQAPAEQAREEPGIVSRAGQALESFGKEGEQANPAQAESHGPVTNFLSTAAEAPGQALPLLAGAAIGAKTGGAAGALTGTPLGAGIGAAVGGAVGGGAAAGEQTWHEKYHEGLEHGMADDQARDYAGSSATLQAALMGAAGGVGGAVAKGGSLIARAAGFAPATALEAAGEVTAKKALPEFAKGAAELTAVNTGATVAGAAGQAKIDQDAGLQSVSPWEAAMQSLPGAIGSSVGFLPFAALGAHTNAKTAKDVQAKLADGDAHPLARARAAGQVYEAMEKVDPTAADMWRINATQALKTGKPIGLDDAWISGPHKDVFPEIQPKEDQAGAMEGEGPGPSQPQYPPLDPNAQSAWPQRALPAPGGLDVNQIDQEAGIHPQTRQNALDAAQAHADSVELARQAEEARREAAFAANGPLSAAAVDGIHSGLIQAKGAERAETTAQPDQAAAPKAANPAIDEQSQSAIAAWTRQDRNQGMPLHEAQALLTQAGEAGADYSVVPHPKGGYDVIPSALISPQVVQHFAGLQKRAELPAPEHTVPGRMVAGQDGARPPRFGDLPPADSVARQSRMPFATPEAARYRADALTISTGREWEVVPHPMARDKFSVQPKAIEGEFSRVHESPQSTEHEQTQGVNNAEAVRSDQGQPGDVGQVAAGRENRGGQDLQQPAQAGGAAGDEQAGREGAQAGVQQDEVARQDAGANLHGAGTLARPVTAAAHTDLTKKLTGQIPEPIIRNRQKNGTPIFDLTPRDKTHVAGIVQELQRLGLPDSHLDDLTPFHTFTQGAGHAQYAPVSDTVGIHREQLDAARTNPMVAREVVFKVAHELTHRIGHDGSGRQPFSSDERSKVLGMETTPDGVRQPSGAMMFEAVKSFAYGPPELRRLLRYPLAAWDLPENHPFGQGYGGVSKVIKEEVFAQLGALYRTNPELMRKWLPKSFEVFDEINRESGRPGVSINEARRAVRTALWSRDAEGRRGEQHADRGAERTNAASAGLRYSDRGMGGEERSAVRERGEERGGAADDGLERGGRDERSAGAGTAQSGGGQARFAQALADYPKSLPGPHPVARAAAEDYMRAAGRPYRPPTRYVRVDPAYSRKVASAYDAMKHDPSAPKVQAAYDAMLNETVAQWRAIEKTGLKITFGTPEHPYPYKIPHDVFNDVRDNNHMWVFPTDAGFGGAEGERIDTAANPLLRKTDVVINGKQLVANDVFRIVHDYFGHIADGNGFRADGEENAWRAHSAMYSDEARKAMTSETRGQNSWVNFGPFAEKNRGASESATEYAPQKTGLLPDEFAHDNYERESDKLDREVPRNQATLDDFAPGKVKNLLRKKNWAVVTAENPRARQLPDDLNAARNKRLERDLQKIGAQYTPAVGKYGGNDEHSFIVTGITPEQAAALRDKYAQDSILTRNGFEHTDGSVTPATGVSEHATSPSDFFTRVPSTGAHFTVDLSFDKRSAPTKVPDDIAKHLTPEELKSLGEGRDRVAKLISVMNELPPTKDFQHAALAGRAARGWYKRSLAAIEHTYGADSPRFVSLMAALSPQTDVRMNFYNAARVWHAWDNAGRPTDQDKLKRIFTAKLVTDKSREEGKNAMNAWVQNGTRALTTIFPEKLRLSGPKVDSFRRNLMGDSYEVTNDRHNANFGGISQALFGGTKTKASPLLEKGPGYIAFSARMRQAAAELTKSTGEKWTPAEAQETVWSFWKALYDLATAKGETRSALQLLRDGELTHEMVRRVPDLGSFIDDEEYRGIAARGRTAVNFEPRGDEAHAEQGSARETGAIAATPALERIARRADRLIADRAEAERLKAEEKSAAQEAEDERAAIADDGHFDEGEDDDIKFSRDNGDGTFTTAAARELLGKMTGGKAAESEAQFSKSGKVLREKDAGPQPIADKNKPSWVRDLSPDQQEALRKAGVWTEQKPLRERLKDLKHDAGLKILQGTVDQFRPILAKIGEYPYKLLRMAASSDAGLEAGLHYGQLELNDYGALQVRHGTKGLLKVLKPLQGEHDRFLSWIAGNRAEQLATEDREHLFSDTDVAALKSLNLGKMANGEARAAVYASVLRDYNEFSKSVLDIAEKAGIIDGEKRSLWEKQFYVPFYREADDGDRAVKSGNLSGMVNQYAFKKLTGGEGVLHDLLANTMQNWNHLLNASLKNNAAWQTLEHASDLGIARQLKTSEVSKGDVYVLDKGKQVYYRVEDPLVLDAISSLEQTPFRGPAMKAIGKFKHLLTVGTTASPIFRIRHTFREQLTALAANPTGYNFVKNWVDGFQYSSRNNPVYGNMLAGGSFFRMGMSLEADRAAYVKQLIAHGVDQSSVLDTPAKVKKALSSAWEWWQETGERSDSITRANLYRQEYERRIQAGEAPDKAHFEAAYVARDAMDYSLHGTWPAIRMLTQMVPFMNARMQGLYKLGRGAAEDPKRFSAVVGGVTLATIALSLAYRDDKDMQAREEWDRDNNWAFKVGDKMFRIPKPFELGAIGTVVDRALEVALNGFNPEDRERFAQQLIPIIGSQLNLNPIPQAIYPIVETWANKNVFRGRSIETEHDRSLSTQQRFGPNTSMIARGASTAMGAVLPDAATLSPKQIDFLVNAYLGWVGTHAVLTADLAVRQLTDQPSRPAARVDDYFLLGDFVKQLPQEQSRFTEQFYKHLTDVQQAFGDMRLAQQTGQMEQLAEVMKEKGNDIQLHGLYIRTQRELGKLNQRERWLNMRTMDPDQKRAELDRLGQVKLGLMRVAEQTRAGRL